MKLKVMENGKLAAYTTIENSSRLREPFAIELIVKLPEGAVKISSPIGLSPDSVAKLEEMLNHFLAELRRPASPGTCPAA